MRSHHFSHWIPPAQALALAWRRLVCRAGRGLALLAAGLLGAAALAQAQAQTPYATITSAGPITRIFVGDELALQVERNGAAPYQVYPSSGRPGDYGTFAVIDGVLYAPNMTAHGGGGTASGMNSGTATAFTPVEQTAVTGAGTRLDPYAITTTVDAGATGIRLVQTLTYAAGDEFLDVNTRLFNSGASDKTVLLYRAMDCYLGGSDTGYGLLLQAAPGGRGIIACAKYEAGQLTVIEGLTFPASTPDMTVNYQVDRYGTIWNIVRNKQPFNNSVYVTGATAANPMGNAYDNGVGVSWSVTVPAGGFLDVPNVGMFAPAVPLTTAVSVAPPEVTTAGGQVTYTVTVHNDNDAPVPLATLTATLPAGFSYVSGSTTGDVAGNPAITGQALAWDASAATVPAHGGISFTFRAQVTAGLPAGSEHVITVEGDAGSDGYSVMPSINVAPVQITITEGGTSNPAPTRTTPIPAVSEPALALLALALAAVAAVTMRRRRA